MTSYSFPSIYLNGRNIELTDIVSGQVTSYSEFEVNTFSFIKNWMEGSENFIQQTSGSTGEPKSITITRQQMIASAKLTEVALKLSSADTALVCLDPAYIAGKMMLVRSFVTNMKIVAISPSSNPLLYLPPDVKIDFAAVVPLQLTEIFQAKNGSRLNDIRKTIVGGAAISIELLKKLSSLRCEIFATYGMTETVSHIALQSLNGPYQSDFFVPLPGVKIDKDDRGCLVLQVPFLADEIVTNDLVDIRDASHFKWVGRVDNIINSGALKIIPEKIESEISKVLVDLGEACSVLVTSLPDNRLGNKIICLIEGDLDQSEIEKVKEKLASVLSPYEVPKAYFSVEMFVYTSSGKFDRRRTTEKFLDNSHF